MCTPPFCEPARRCLGCISLRKAASLIVLLNAVYGFMMVVIHMFIFRERTSIMESMRVEYNNVAATPMPQMAAGADGGGITSRHDGNWYLQLLDLDIAWAHGVLGIGDWYLCMLGLLYGVTVIAFSIFVLHSVITYSRTGGAITRWFMMFLHLELILYICLALVKLPLLCKAKHHFLTLLDMDCSVLRFMYFERALLRIIIGALCCWVFSSFAYLLAWGDAAVDDPTLGDTVDSDLRNRAWRPSAAGGDGRVYPVSDGRAGTRASFDQVGEPVSVASNYEPRWAGGQRASTSFASAPSGGPMGGSFAASGRFTSGGYAPSQQYIMPRAASSIQSNTTDVSAERQMLIKPPIVIH